MKALKKIWNWLKQFKKEMERESISQVKSTPHCCSHPIATSLRKR